MLIIIWWSIIMIMNGVDMSLEICGDFHESYFLCLKENLEMCHVKVILFISNDPI